MTDDFGFGFAFDEPRTPQRVPLYRMRRDDSAVRVARFYTASVAERMAAAENHGFAEDGVIGVVYDAPVTGTVPLVRLWHHPSSVHSFTVVPENLEAAIARGTYRHEGVTGHVFVNNKLPGTVPLYALVHRPTNVHLYTADAAERDAAVAAGHEALGVACWVYPAEVPV